jgi:pimeloyl-ACP methyl ester carboxylesterase
VVCGVRLAGTLLAAETVAVERPETRYAKSGDLHVAYQVTGDGPFDLVWVPGFFGGHLELEWNLPGFAGAIEQFSSFSRLIRLDPRGTGMSDRVSGAPTLEMRMDDIRAVLDAVGSRRAAFFGLSEGAALSILFAATYPDRTAALVVRSAFPRRMWASEYPWGLSEEQYAREVERDLRLFGPREGALDVLRARGPFDEHAAGALLELVRLSSSPGSVETLHRMNKEIDVRHVLPAVRVPTLVLRGAKDTVVSPEVARYVASRIPTARLVEIPGIGHLALGDALRPVVEEIEAFLKEVWDAGGWEEQEPERVLATVLFTDIVGSTAKAVELGDRAWRELLERHHALIRRELVRFRGAELDVAGDGFFARFDGPARAVRCACAITESVRQLGIELRAGLHTGECEVLEGKVGGVAVHIGARVAKQAQPGEVLVSSTVKDLVAGSGLRFRDRGAADLKGVGEEWRLFAVETAGG